MGRTNDGRAGDVGRPHTRQALDAEARRTLAEGSRLSGNGASLRKGPGLPIADPGPFRLLDSSSPSAGGNGLLHCPIPLKPSMAPAASTHNGCMRVVRVTSVVTVVMTARPQLWSEARTISAALAATRPTVIGTKPICTMLRHGASL